MKALLGFCVFTSLAGVAGCATSGGLFDRDDTGPGAGGSANIPTNASRAQAMPDRISDASLPEVDKLASRIVSDHRGVISNQVRLCVAPDGTVASVEVVEPSGMPAYDEAAVESIKGWQYESFEAAPEARICQKLTVGYRTP